MTSQDDDKKPLDLTPEQIRALLASDFETAEKPSAARAARSSSRRLFWAVVILLAGVLYAVGRFALAPAKVIVINSSGEDAASIVLISGAQRIDLGSLANGESRTVKMIPGHPLRVELRFAALQTWTASRPLTPFQSITIFISVGEKIDVREETPWGSKP